MARTTFQDVRPIPGKAGRPPARRRIPSSAKIEPPEGIFQPPGANPDTFDFVGRLSNIPAPGVGASDKKQQMVANVKVIAVAVLIVVAGTLAVKAVL